MHRLQILQLGLPYGAREFDEERKVMTKCTLCVDRIYDELLPPQDLRPACVSLSDWRPPVRRRQGSDSEVSQAIRERGGYQLMPEWETQPANHYLPRQITLSTVPQAQPNSGWAIS